MSGTTLSPADALRKLQLTKEIAAAIMCGSNISGVQATQFRKLGCSPELLARLNMSEAVIRSSSLFRDPLAKHNHITGKVGGRPKKPKAVPITWERGAASNQPNLMYPVSRPSRPVGNGGGRTFHMEETIAYTEPTGSQSAAKARHNYALDASKVPIVEAQLAGASLERGLYLYRDEVAVEKEGLRLAYTSMGNNDEMVISQWQLIGETETRKVGKPILPRISIDKSQSPNDGFWDRLSREEDAPDTLKAFIHDERLSAITFIGDAFKPVECFLRKNGWHHRSEELKRKDIRFYQGRNPIAQRRLVFELPKLSLEGIERIVQNLGKEFHKRNLPFVLVVHRPDENNHEDNWHIHLDYHHRPMQRFDPAKYLLPPLPEATETKKLAQRAIIEKALSDPDPAWTGKWDAEIQYEYRTDSGRKKVAYPFVQDVHPDTRDDDWLLNLRKRFADIINSELEREQSDTRFDPRRLDEQGIAKIGDAHLGLKLSYLERTGKPTKTGAQNEQNQWDHEHKELLKRYPDGNKAEGKTENVAGYTSGYMKLILSRMQSRPNFTSYFARRQSDSDRQVHPSPTTERRNKRRDYRFEQLAQLADQTLANINEIWSGISEWAVNLDARLLAHAKQTQSQSNSQPQQSDAPREKVATRGSSDFATSPTFSGVQNEREPQPPKHAKTGDAPASNEAVPPRDKAARPSSFNSQIVLLYEHNIPFEIGRLQLPDGGWALAANLSKADASQHHMPLHVIARVPEEKRLLMRLHQFRTKRMSRDNIPEQSEPADVQPGSIETVAPDATKQSEKLEVDAPVVDGATSIKNRRDPKLEAVEFLTRGQGSKDPIRSNKQEALTSASEQDDNRQNKSEGPRTGEDTQVKDNENSPKVGPQMGAGQDTRNDPMIALLQRARCRDILLIPRADGGLLVRDPREGSRVVAVGELACKAGAELSALSMVQHKELAQLGNFVARNAAQMQQTGWRERLLGSQAGEEFRRLFSGWCANADFKRAVAECSKFPAPDSSDAEDLGRREGAFALLLLNNASAMLLVDEIHRRAASIAASKTKRIDPKAQEDSGRINLTEFNRLNVAEKDQREAAGPAPELEKPRPDIAAPPHQISLALQHAAQGWGS